MNLKEFIEQMVKYGQDIVHINEKASVSHMRQKVDKDGIVTYEEVKENNEKASS